MAKALEEIHEPPPGPGGFDGHRSFGRELREKPSHALDVIDESMPHEFAVLGEHRNLRRPFVQVDTHVYHRLGLLSQSGFGSLSEVPAYFRLTGRPTCLWHHYEFAGTDLGSS